MKKIQTTTSETSLVHLTDTLQALTEFLTGVVTSEKKEWALSIGYLVQRIRGGEFLKQLAEEIRRYRDKGKIKADYLNTEQSKSCLQELLDFVDKDIPDKSRFDAIKAIFLTITSETLSDRNDVVPLQLMKICRSLSSSELLLLVATYKLSKQDDWKVQQDKRKMNESIGNTYDWEQAVLPVSGLKFIELIKLNEESLVRKRLLSQNEYPDGSGFRYTANYRLTPLGYDLCRFIHDYHPDK
jgi:hypothetical protein